MTLDIEQAKILLENSGYRVSPMIDFEARQAIGREVKKLTEQGHSAREIAARLGIHQRTVARWRKRLGIAQPTPTRVPRELWLKAEEMLADGASYREVSITLGRPCESHLALHFPQYGLSRSQASQVARMGRQLNSLRVRA